MKQKELELIQLAALNIRATNELASILAKLELERDEAQEAAERFRASMYALEERVAELTRERDQWKKLAESRAFDEFDAEIDG